MASEGKYFKGDIHTLGNVGIGNLSASGFLLIAIKNRSLDLSKNNNARPTENQQYPKRFYKKMT